MNGAARSPETADVDSLRQSLLLEDPLVRTTPPPIATPLIRVVAPATLEEGIEFDAFLEDERRNSRSPDEEEDGRVGRPEQQLSIHRRLVRVRVPTGGVQEGEPFSVPRSWLVD